jgi:cytochrome P450
VVDLLSFLMVNDGVACVVLVRKKNSISKMITSCSFDLSCFIYVAHNGLIKSQINLYQPILDKRRTILLSHLYNQISEEKGVNPTYLLEHYTMSSILTIAFGDICSFEPGNPAVREAFELTERTAEALSPSDQLREFFPILKKFWPVKRKQYLVVRRDLLEYYGNILAQFKESMAKDSSKVPDCFVKEILRQNELTDLQIMHFIGIFVSGGSDTTTSTLRWMIAHLANHPEIQDKAYEEIKRVVGLDRLPGANDGK